MCSSTKVVRATRSPRRARAARRSEWPLTLGRAVAGTAALNTAAADSTAITPRIRLLRPSGREGLSRPGWVARVRAVAVLTENAPWGYSPSQHGDTPRVGVAASVSVRD